MTAALLAILAILLSHCDRTPPEAALTQKPPTAASAVADRVWKWTALERLETAQNRTQSIETHLTQELDHLEGAPKLLLPDETETLAEGSYGVLPDVYVDKNYGLSFPKPIEAPERIAWFRTLLEVELYLDLLDDFGRMVAQWQDLPEAKRLDTYSKVEGAWLLINSRLSEIVARVRYLETWIPRLSARDRQPRISQLFSLAISHDVPDREKAELWDKLRELLRPHRVLSRPFLPKTLKPGTYVLPVVTDIRDRKFLAEVEGAIETHWNGSPWARAHRIRFEIRWTRVALNAKFRKGEMDLDEHVATFPKNKLGMTTGGDTSFVRDNVFVLSPGRITPRTLAHEFGHLLGFEDCYFRTLSGQGARGFEILEWSNPIYGDDLMCDNREGVARSNVW